MMRSSAVGTAAAILSVGPAGLAAQTPAEKAAIRPIAVEHTMRRIVHLDAPIDNLVAAAPSGHIYLALQTRPDPLIWVLPVRGEPFTFRKNWAAYRPRWAGSGNRIGFISAIGPPRVWTVEVDSASGRALDPPRMLIRTSANAFAFSPDGARIALVASRSTAAGASEIHIIEWSSRRSRRLLREDGLVYWLDWSPDGAFIYYGLAPNSSAQDPHAVKRVEVRGGRGDSARALFEVREYLGLAPDGARILYRPLDPGSAEENVFQVSGIEGDDTPLRFTLPPGPVPRWGASSTTLVRVRQDETGADIVEISLTPR